MAEGEAEGAEGSGEADRQVLCVLKAGADLARLASDDAEDFDDLARGDTRDVDGAEADAFDTFVDYARQRLNRFQRVGDLLAVDEDVRGRSQGGLGLQQLLFKRIGLADGLGKQRAERALEDARSTVDAVEGDGNLRQLVQQGLGADIRSC